MQHEIKWGSDLKAALALAAAQKKCVLLDFFNPG